MHLNVKILPEMNTSNLNMTTKYNKTIFSGLNHFKTKRIVLLNVRKNLSYMLRNVNSKLKICHILMSKRLRLVAI